MPRSRPIWASEKPCRLARRSRSRSSSGAVAHLGGDLVDQRELVEEPRVDAGRLVHLLDGGAGPQRLLHVAQPAVVRHARPGRASSRLVDRARAVPAERRVPALQRAQRLLQRLGEAAADRHRLADHFMCVVSVGSAPGNFSNANRGTLTTT